LSFFEKAPIDMALLIRVESPSIPIPNIPTGKPTEIGAAELVMALKVPSE